MKITNLWLNLGFAVNVLIFILWITQNRGSRAEGPHITSEWRSEVIMQKIIMWFSTGVKATKFSPDSHKIFFLFKFFYCCSITAFFQSTTEITGKYTHVKLIKWKQKTLNIKGNRNKTSGLALILSKLW